MADNESTRAPGARKPELDGVLLEEAVMCGMVPRGVRVRELPELDAVQLAVMNDYGAAEVEVLLTPGAAVEMAFRLASAAVRVAVQGDLT